MPTIADVARTAGVDKSTVSRALNGTGRVSEDTRQRIVAAVELLGYRPSRLAQGFRTGATGTLGLLVRSLTMPGSSDFIAGVLDVVEVAGYAALIAEAPRNAADLPRSLDFPIEGAICFGRIDPNHVHVLRSRGMPVVEAGACFSGHEGPASEREAAREAFTSLLERGFEQIRLLEFVEDPEGDPVVRLDALRQTVGAKCREPIEVHSVAQARAATTAVLREDPHTAFVAGAQALLPAVIRGVDDAHQSGQEPVPVVSYTRFRRFAQPMYPDISLVAHDVRLDGRAAASSLIESITGRPPVLLPHWRQHWEYLDRMPAPAVSACEI